MERVADRLPVAVGVNPKVIVQDAPAARLCPQVLVWTKSVALGPPIEMLVIFTKALPLLVTMIFLVLLFVPTGTLPKGRVVADRPTKVPIPERDTL